VSTDVEGAYGRPTSARAASGAIRGPPTESRASSDPAARVSADRAAATSPISMSQIAIR
jgi:hypothetical protein